MVQAIVMPNDETGKICVEVLGRRKESRAEGETENMFCTCWNGFQSCSLVQDSSAQHHAVAGAFSGFQLRACATASCLSLLAGLQASVVPA